MKGILPSNNLYIRLNKNILPGIRSWNHFSRNDNIINKMDCISQRFINYHKTKKNNDFLQKMILSSETKNLINNSLPIYSNENYRKEKLKHQSDRIHKYNLEMKNNSVCLNEISGKSIVPSQIIKKSYSMRHIKIKRPEKEFNEKKRLSDFLLLFKFKNNKKIKSIKLVNRKIPLIQEKLKNYYHKLIEGNNFKYTSGIYSTFKKFNNHKNRLFSEFS